MGKESTIRIGTSGWSYAHWKEAFYPADIKDEEMLSFYCRHLRCVEINNSFYHLPERTTLKHWYDISPVDFLFCVKASRYITHMKKLKDPKQGLRTFFERITALGDKLGPVLFQLPPNWHYNHERLSTFLESLSKEFSYAIEFRDRSWLNERSYELLGRHGVAFCIYDINGFLSPRQVSADFVYLRLHGPGQAYQGSYGKQALSGWAGAISSWSAQGKTVYCFFDNDEAGYAPQNALDLQAMLIK